MSEIKRIEVDDFWADSTIIEAGDYVFVGYCMANEGKSIEEYANSFEAGDSITFWLTFQEVKDTYFN